MLRNQRGDRGMRPAQTGEVEDDQLRVLDLGGGDGDRLGCGDRMRRLDHEGRYLGARMRGGGRNMQGRFPGRPDWNYDLVLHLLDPEGGRHLDRICVRVRGGSCSTQEEGDVGGATTQFGCCGVRGDGKDSRLGDVLSDDGVAQYGVRVVQHGLGNCARRNEFGKVLRQSRGVFVGHGLAGEWDLVGGADHKRSDVHRCEFGWTCEAGGGR